MFLNKYLRPTLIFLSVFASFIGMQSTTAQTAYNLTLSPQTSTNTEGVLYDSGGANGNYGDNQNAASTVPANAKNYTFNIRPASGGCVEITLDGLGIEPSSDTLLIFDGNTNVLLDAVNGTSNKPLTFQVSTNWVLVRFSSDGSVNGRGFKLAWKTLAACTTKATTCAAPELIPSLPFGRTTTTCDDLLGSVTGSPCPGNNNFFLDGKDHVFKYTSTGGQCIKVTLTDYILSSTLGSFGIPTGINVGVYLGCPSASSGVCVAQGIVNPYKDSVFVTNAKLDAAGDYYIVVSRAEACTPFKISIEDAPCLNRLPNAGFCDKALNINDCSNKTPTDLILDISNKGDASFILTGANASANAGCITTLGNNVNNYNYVFLTFKAQADGLLGFTVAPIVADFQSDIDFNVYGPIDNPTDACTYAKNTAPVRTSGGQENEPATGGKGYTGLDASVTDPNAVCENSSGDGLLARLLVKKDKYYVIWINDFKGSIGTNGVRLNFNGTTNGVLDSLGDPLSKFSISKDTVVCVGQTAQLSAKGGIGYTWTPPSGLSNAKVQNPTATVSQPTKYTVSIQGTCRVVPKSVNVDIFKINPLTNATVCKGEELTFNAGDYPLSSGAVWTWTSPSGHLSDLSCTTCGSPTFKASNTSNVLETHVYNVSLKAPNCNALTATVTIQVNPLPVANYQVITSLKPTRDTNVCKGGTFNLLKNGFDNSAIYTWASVPASPLMGNNPSVSPSVNTKYYVTVTGGVGNCPATSTDSVIVNVYQKPVLVTIPDTNVCVGTIITLGNSAFEDNTTYKWSNPNGLNKTDIPNPILTVVGSSNQTISSYVLTATNIGGCVVQSTVNVTGINISAKIDNARPLTLCKGTPVTLNAKTTPVGLPVKWDSDRDFSVPNDSAKSISVMPDRFTRYFISMKQGGCTVKDTLVVAVDSLPFNTLILPKDTMVCNGTQISFISTPYEPILFTGLKSKWARIGTQITADSFYNLVILADVTRTYSRVITNGVCTKTDTVRVIVNETPKITLLPRDTSLCSNNLNAIILNATSDKPDLTGEWRWKIDGKDAAQYNDKTFISTSMAGTYKVTGKIANCPGAAEMTIKVVDPPAIGLPTNPSICAGGSLPLNSIPLASTTYKWTGPGGFTSQDKQPTAVVAGTYSVTVTSVDKCVTTKSIDVVVATGSVTISPDVKTCAGTPATLTATGTSNIGGGTYRWSTGATTQAINPPTNANGSYVVTFTFGNNCTATATGKVTVEPNFSLIIEPKALKDSLIEQGSTLTLTAVASGNITTPTYTWASGETTQTISVKPSGSTTYTVKVNNPTTNCTNESSINLKIRVPNYEVPNAFTPNGDTINAFFNIVFDDRDRVNNPRKENPRLWKGGIQIQSMQIYNRMGNLVYEEMTPSVLNGTTYKGWDGKKNGDDVPSDVYVYLIKLTLPDGSPKNLSGELNLIR